MKFLFFFFLLLFILSINPVLAGHGREGPADDFCDVILDMASNEYIAFNMESKVGKLEILDLLLQILNDNDELPLDMDINPKDCISRIK